MAVKDNIAVAGLPMMNGSRAVEGFVPSRDATVVQRLLAAGATIAGKSVCEDLCCFGFELHLRVRAGAQPMGHHARSGRIFQRQRRTRGRR